MDMDLKKVEPFIGKAKDRLYRIGIELEGGWEKLPEGIRELEHDGSVRIQIAATKLEDVYTPDQIKQAQSARITLPPINGCFKKLLTGEIPSMVLEVKDYPTWMRKYYPHFVNETCGMHVHMSFTSALHYQKLMTPDFTQVVVAYMSQWAKENGLGKSHPIWSRLAGKSQYCQPKFFADEQARQVSKDHNRERHGNRYTMINYCWGLRQTIECRLLPMMDTPELGIKAVQAILDITNACLASGSGIKGERRRVNVKVENGDEEYNEVRRLRI